MDTQNKGQFEQLVSDIENELSQAEGGWNIEQGSLVIFQRESRDPSRRNNGGEYDYYKVYCPTGLGVDVWESWSCDIAPRRQYGGQEYSYDVIVGLDGLRRIAQLAIVTIAAKSWLAKEPGSMKNLKAAIRSLGEGN